MLNQTRNPGESVYFRCQIDMSKCMVAFIDWYHEGLDGSARRKVKNAREGDPHTHHISRVSPDHEGLYTCVVGNGESPVLSAHMIYTQAWPGSCSAKSLPHS